MTISTNNKNKKLPTGVKQGGERGVRQQGRKLTEVGACDEMVAMEAGAGIHAREADFFWWRVGFPGEITTKFC